MIDVQSRHDSRGISLDQVGVTDLKYPNIVLDREQEMQHTVASKLRQYYPSRQ